MKLSSSLFFTRKVFSYDNKFAIMTKNNQMIFILSNKGVVKW